VEPAVLGSIVAEAVDAVRIGDEVSGSRELVIQLLVLHRALVLAFVWRAEGKGEREREGRKRE
jgi:hypothetical protein